MLIFYNWGGGSIRGGGLWHFTEFRGGILIGKEFSKYYQTALPLLPPSPQSPSPRPPVLPLPLPPSPPPPHIISVNFLLNTTFHQLFTETHIDLRCTSTYHKWDMRGEV